MNQICRLYKIEKRIRFGTFIRNEMWSSIDLIIVFIFHLLCFFLLISLTNSPRIFVSFSFDIQSTRSRWSHTTTRSQQTKIKMFKIENLFTLPTFTDLGSWSLLCLLAGWFCVYLFITFGLLTIYYRLSNEWAQFIACPNSTPNSFECWSIPNWEILKGLMWNRKRERLFPHELNDLLDSIVSQLGTSTLPHAEDANLCLWNKCRQWFVDARKYFPHFFESNFCLRSHVYSKLIPYTRTKEIS